MEMPKITIVTPVYNGENYIEKTIKSVLNQNYPNLEYMIIDGGSTDKTVEIIKKYSDKLSYWISEKDDGLYSAIQKGFNQATGEILAWINSDDYYSENCFEIVAEIFTKFKDIEWLTGLTTAYNEKNWVIGSHPSTDFTRFDLLSGNFQWIQQESTFWRKSLWEKAGSKLGKYKLADDFELWLRFSRYAKLYCVDCYLGGFRQRSKDQLSLEGLEKYLEECKQAIKEEPKTKEEISAVKKINFWRGIEKILIKLKVFNKGIPIKFIQRINNKKYGNRRLKFDRVNQKFML